MERMWYLRMSGGCIRNRTSEISDTKTTSGIVFIIYILRHSVIILVAFLLLFFPKFQNLRLHVTK